MRRLCIIAVQVLYRAHGLTGEEEEVYPGGDDYEYEGYEEGGYDYEYDYSAYDAGADTGPVQFYSMVRSDWLFSALVMMLAVTSTFYISNC